MFSYVFLRFPRFFGVDFFISLFRVASLACLESVVGRNDVGIMVLFVFMVSIYLFLIPYYSNDLNNFNKPFYS